MLKHWVQNEQQKHCETIDHLLVGIIERVDRKMVVATKMVINTELVLLLVVQNLHVAEILYLAPMHIPSDQNVSSRINHLHNHYLSYHRILELAVVKILVEEVVDNQMAPKVYLNSFFILYLVEFVSYWGFILPFTSI